VNPCGETEAVGGRSEDQWALTPLGALLSETWVPLVGRVWIGFHDESSSSLRMTSC